MEKFDARAFAKSRKAPIGFVMYVYPPVRPSYRRLPMDGFA